MLGIKLNLNKNPKTKQVKKTKPSLLKRLGRGVLITLLVFYVLSVIATLSGPPVDEISLSQSLDKIKAGEVEEVTVIDNRIQLKLHSGETLFTQKETNISFTETLKSSGIDPADIDLKINNQDLFKIIADLIATFAPLALTGFIFWFIFKQAGKAQSSLFSFGKSRARFFRKNGKATFSNVAGLEEAKKELEEVVDFLKNPEKYRRMGARTPKGVLLIGPSGTGKTLMARAVAGEAKVPFLHMAGSEFMEMLVGIGASVTGDTPILIRKKGKTRLLPIADFIDRYYKKGETDKVKKVKGVETLGFEKARNNFWGAKSEKSERSVFEKSSWKPIQNVYRHRAKEIYKIHFLGGVIRTTGDHSVFVRVRGWITPKKVSELKPGDILVNLPMNMRYWDKKQRKTKHKIKKHEFPDHQPLFLDVWGDEPEIWEKHQYVIDNPDNLYQHQLAQQVGVCQTTVCNWQHQIHLPRAVSKKAVKLNLPAKVKVTPELMELLGLYTAEGRGTNNLELTLGVHEQDIVNRVVKLMEKVFGIKKPTLEKTDTNSIRVKYYSAHLGRLFTRLCGNGSHNKHAPEFIWDLPKTQFLAYLKGYTDGDGYITKTGKLCASSVSQRLIRELTWLCSMHGIKVGVKHEIVKGGRVIRDKPLPDSEVWTLIIGKTSNPFLEESKSSHHFKKCRIRKIIKKPYQGFVYDLCGVENEAFFGGEQLILLHNSRVRDLFSTARKAKKAIIFIDELDAIGAVRGLGATPGHGEREQTLNQLLVEMDGLEPNETIILLAATNRPDILDPALTRPGRFDRTISLSLPDLEERIEILKLHAKGKPFVKNVSWKNVARRTVGFSGADLENMLNEAAILAARTTKTTIGNAEIDEASIKVKLGPQKKRLVSEEEKKISAYHEAGHAVVNFFSPKTNPVEKISIVSRGIAAGYTFTPPEKDRFLEEKTRILSQIAVLMGGRAAEEMVFKEKTTGAAADIQQATSIARQMVVKYGMSSLGPIYFAPQVDITEWGQSFIRPEEISPETQTKVDLEIKKIIDSQYQAAKIILEKQRKKLDLVAEKLLEKETLERNEFEKLVQKPA